MTEFKKNLIWAAVFALITAVSLAVTVLGKSFLNPPKTARILQNGEVVRTVSLDITEPYEFNVVSEDGGYNTIRVENGRIGVISADCPDKICVRRGFIENGVLPVVCLPHKLSIVITDESDTDAVSGGINVKNHVN